MEKQLLEQRYNLAMAEFQQLKNESESRVAKKQGEYSVCGHVCAAISYMYSTQMEK